MCFCMWASYQNLLYLSPEASVGGSGSGEPYPSSVTETRSWISFSLCLSPLVLPVLNTNLCMNLASNWELNNVNNVKYSYK